MTGTARKHQLERSLSYHVYSRACNRQVIFNQPEDFEYFKRLLREYGELFSCRIYHWVIMSNHYHLVIELLRPEKLSKMMAGLHRAYTCYHHRSYATVGFLWQGRFKMQPIQKELYLMACGRYVERNPVRAGMVGQACEYAHSSARYYCLGVNDDITSPDFCFQALSEDIRRRQEEYREFLMDFDQEKERYFAKLDRPCGDREFIKKLIFQNRHLIPRRKGRSS